MRTNFSRLAGVVLLVVTAAACRQDMHDQPKYQPLEASTFFGDAQSSRPFVEGTVARGHLNEDALLYSGKVDGGDSLLFPFPVDEKVMARGHERFDIYCQPYHGATGNGDGMVVQRGFKRPPAYSEQRLRDAAPGYLFDVISRGFGAMPDYAAQIKVTDRWAIVAYVRALQLSAHAALEDVPAADRGRLDQPPAGADAPRAETERH